LDTLLTYAGFQDRCFQPLSHLSVSAKNNIELTCCCKGKKSKKGSSSHFSTKYATSTQKNNSHLAFKKEVLAFYIQVTSSDMFPKGKFPWVYNYFVI
ncbi:hypothetical protein, partial [Photobacterium leiognathi]|uniref:hypothetical protein n=1 Tax=Photobacterium leiognathi TaxID=553611 RepID=UPI002982140A